MNSKSYLPYKDFKRRKITKFDEMMIRKLYKYLNIRTIAYILGLNEKTISAYVYKEKLKKSDNKELLNLFSDLPILIIDKRSNYEEE